MKLGEPSKRYNPESYGVNLKPGAEKIVVPEFLFYVMQYLHSTGMFERFAKGTTNLKNIEKPDILNIPVRM